eukprot:763739-Hanusia_phi.AAC.2
MLLLLLLLPLLLLHRLYLHLPSSSFSISFLPISSTHRLRDDASGDGSDHEEEEKLAERV